MKRTVHYEPNLGETALAILLDLGEGFVKSFFPHPYYHIFCEHKAEASFRRSLRRLAEKKLLYVVRDGDDGKLYALTEKGKKLAKRIKRRLDFSRKKRWDGKWRIIIFDIPEKMRGKRDLLRRELIYLDFYPLQKSVWVTPYALPAHFSELLEGFGRGEDVFMIKTKQIEGAEWLKDFFFPRA